MHPTPSKANIFLLVVVALAIGAVAGWTGRGLVTADAGRSDPVPSVGSIDSQATDSIRVYFSPRGGAQEAILEEIRRARRSIHVAMYSMTARPIADALIEARQRGVEVVAVLDRTQAASRYSAATILEAQGAEVWIATGSGYMHHKFAIIDGQVLITGSKNWSARAEERNHENVMILEGRSALVEAFAGEFERLRAAAERRQR
jgi:phosphatidylserine/phosphatidylglycerophosphate/cardiolipin synthase-like enzyme